MYVQVIQYCAYLIENNQPSLQRAVLGALIGDMSSIKGLSSHLCVLVVGM